MRLAGILSALFSFMILGSCAPTEVGDKCLQETSCGVGFICNHQIECTADTDCTKGFLCNLTSDPKVCTQDENEDGAIDLVNEVNDNTPEGVCALVPCTAESICPSGFSCDIVAPATEGVCSKDAQ